MAWEEQVLFFIEDYIKIVLLLFGMVAFVGFLRTYISPETIKKKLSGRGKGVGNLMAAIFGAITPFCSCSSIPIFFGFLKAGVPLGTTFSFLITSPIINEYLVAVMLGFFGWKIALAYVISGIAIGTLGGMLLGRMKLEKHLVKDMVALKMKKVKYKSLKERARFGLGEAVSITKKMWLWILLGVGVGAAIHNFIPGTLINSVATGAGIFSVPLAVLIGVPLYGNCAAIVPVAVALFQKGVPLGTALAFMMAISALSFPEAVMLRRAMKLKLIAIFFGIVTAAIIFTGYLINFLQPVLV